jgi:hypothetical protein
MSAACPTIAEEQLAHLHAGEIHTIAEPAAGMIIRCTSGAAWVTQAGMHDDVVLEAGASFCPRADGKVIVQGLLASAVVSIERL